MGLKLFLRGSISRWQFTRLTAILTTTMILNSQAEENLTPAETLLRSPRPLVIGHRGYAAFAPENTLPSFKLAMAAGADLVELDYYHSSDGVPVVIHDDTLDRTTDAVARWGGSKIRVDSKTAGELSSLSAGNWFQPPRTEVRLPLLTEALDLIQSEGITLIERKGGDAATCIRLLRERDLLNRVVVQSFDWAYLADYHQQEPSQVLGALGPSGSWEGQKLTESEKILNARWIEEILKRGARVAVWNKLVNPEAVALAHQRGLKVWVYTINESALANGLLAMGIDGIITDNPAMIWRAMAVRSLSEKKEKGG